MKLHLAHILVQHKFEAEDIQKKLREGKPFADLARQFSTCSSSAAGGDLGEVGLSRLDATFAEAAQALKPQEISDVVRTRFGYHLIQRKS